MLGFYEAHSLEPSHDCSLEVPSPEAAYQETFARVAASDAAHVATGAAAATDAAAAATMTTAASGTQPQ